MHQEIFWPDIYRRLCENERDRIYGQRVTASYQAERKPSKKWSRHEFYREVLNDMYTDGFVESTPFGRIIRQAQRRFFYRGEKKIYDATQPSLCRRLSNISDPEERRVEKFVAQMRVADFLELILQFEHLKEFQEYEVDILYEQIAQHYGFETQFLDITSDFAVALFFACCKFDENTQEWFPLSKEDFERDKDGRSRYGVIFWKPSWKNEEELYWPGSTPSKCIWPIGYQPFNRCHMQNGYAVKMDLGEDLQVDKGFKALKFRHTETLCNLIFNFMKSGKRIYPQEGLSSISAELNEIKKRKTFSRETFDWVCKNEGVLSKEELEASLNRLNYKVVEIPVNSFLASTIESINNQYKDFDFQGTYGIKLTTRHVHVADPC